MSILAFCAHESLAELTSLYSPFADSTHTCKPCSLIDDDAETCTATTVLSW